MADFSLPPWLAQSNTMLFPDAAASGSHVGATIASGIRARKELEMQQELARQKAAQQAMQFQGTQDLQRDLQMGVPYADALSKNLGKISYNNPALAAKLQETIQSAKDQQQVDEGIKAASAYVSKAFRDKMQNSPDVQANLSALGEKYPKALDSAAWNRTIAPLMQSEKETQAKEMQGLRQQNTMEMQGVRQQAAAELSAERAKNANEKMSPQLKASTEIRDLKRQIAAETDPTKKAELNSTLSELVSAYPAKDTEESVVFGPDGNPIYKTNKGPKINIGPQAKAVGLIANAEKTVEQLNDISRTLKPGDVGFAGVVGEFWDRVAPQMAALTGVELNPDMSRVESRTKLKAGMISMIGNLRQDGRVTETDKKALAELGASSGVWESAPRARKAISIVTDILRKRERVDAEVAHQPIKDWMLTSDELHKKNLEELKAGKITKQQAADRMIKNYPDLFE